MKLKPLGWLPSIIIFLIQASFIRLALYHLTPAYKQATGQPYMVGYLMGWGGAMLVVFLASLVAYRLEGHPTTMGAFIRRYRLDKMERMDWVWTLGMILVGFIFISALSFSMPILQSVPMFSPHPTFPPDMVDPARNLTPGTLFEMPLQGQWWLVAAYTIGWALNILGEEFWYRGWMLPRQEVAFGKYAWLVNGLMFNFQHTFQPWNLLAMLPGSLFVSYAVQRRRKTWMSITWHGLMNASLLVFTIQGVIA